MASTPSLFLLLVATTATLAVKEYGWDGVEIPDDRVYFHGAGEEEDNVQPTISNPNLYFMPRPYFGTLSQALLGKLGTKVDYREVSTAPNMYYKVKSYLLITCIMCTSCTTICRRVLHIGVKEHIILKDLFKCSRSSPSFPGGQRARLLLPCVGREPRRVFRRQPRPEETWRQGG